MNFLINGESFANGDLFTITTPELGTLEAPASKQDYGTGLVVGLTFGWIKTPLPCTYQNGFNARLSFYTNGEGYHTLQLAYFCSCSYEAHNHGLTWYDLRIEGNVITAPGLGVHFNQPHTHPVVSAFAHLKPKPVLPDPAVNKKGQFQLF